VSAHASWWRAHQIIVILVYVISCAVAWQIKDWGRLR
jgi:hypothetical protein